jgi:hypothetical protein
VTRATSTLAGLTKSHAAEANDAVLHVRRVEAVIASPETKKGAPGKAGGQESEDRQIGDLRRGDTAASSTYCRDKMSRPAAVWPAVRWHAPNCARNYTEGGGRGRLAGAGCRGRSPLRPVMARTSIIIPIEDDELDPSGRVGARIHTGNVPRGDASDHVDFPDGVCGLAQRR